MSVIFARAPLRISLGGGGTDLPTYYGRHGGFVIGGAIDKYVYMVTHTVFQRRYRMKYSEFEEVDEPRQIRHPILREAISKLSEKLRHNSSAGGLAVHAPRAMSPRSPGSSVRCTD